MYMTPTHAATFEYRLADYRDTLEPHIAMVCKRLKDQAAGEFGAFSQQTIGAYTSVLNRGGKRLRGSLVLAAYQMCGGQDLSKAMPVAMALEMLQAHLLILDDIYDCSATRRGGPAAHIMMRDLHKKQEWKGDSLHFGEVTAGLAALIGSQSAMAEITKSPLDAQAKVTILQLVNEALVITGYGQLNDVFNEATRNTNEESIQDMLAWKTAYYSFVNPLQAGAVAAGERAHDLACLKHYGLHMGLAFQISDDILGTFGNETKSGKSAKDDLREGKMTLLVSHALAKATPEQHSTLLRHLGNRDVTNAEYESCKEIMRQTGALDYARAQAEHYGKLAITALDAAPRHWDAGQLAFLRDMAVYVVSRTA